MIDRQHFFASVREPLFGGVIEQGQVDGCNAILDGWDKWQTGADLRFIAYSLATTFHETARTMQPVREIGEGRGMAYGHPAGPWHQVYYGRGDVQETWEANYRFATLRLRALKVIGADLDLERDADLALRPDISAAILIFGMVEGWFTHRKLAQYFTKSGSDWVNARRIINGTDMAQLIAGYGTEFYAAMRPVEAAA